MTDASPRSSASWYRRRTIALFSSDMWHLTGAVGAAYAPLSGRFRRRSSVPGGARKGAAMLVAGTGSGIYGYSPQGDRVLTALEGEDVTAVAVAHDKLLATVRAKGLLESGDGGRSWA